MKEKKTVDERMVREVLVPKPALPAPPPLAPAWEYKTVVGRREADLNSFGADGWELIAAIPQPGDQTAYYFKRRK